MKYYNIFTYSIIIIIISIMNTPFSGCRQDGSVSALVEGNRKTIDRLNWSERNYNVLNQFINDYGIGGKYYDSKKPPYAVLDWDQTCAHFDTEEAAMRYQIYNFRFKMTKAQFRDLLKDEINGVKQLSANYNNILLKDINEDLVNDYNYLYDNFSGLGGNLPLAEIQKTPQFKDFLTRLPFLYDGYCDTKGIESAYGYPFVIYLFAGFTIEEVKNLTNEAITYELGNAIAKQKWETPAGFPSKSGSISYSFKSGLRVYPEMQDLIQTFKDNGIDVYIVSASYKHLVETFSGIRAYGYNVSSEKVIAMELEIGTDNKILPKYKSGWVEVLGQGKVDAINTVIKNNLGKNWDPIFSAGDSDGDYEMCTMFSGTKLTLLWNRLKSGNIGKLCAQAVAEKNNPTPRYILQGRNENTGMVIPSSETILFGKTVPQLLP